MRSTLALAFTVVVAGVTLTAQPPARHAETLRPEILGTHGIVAAGRHYSVSAGVRIIQQGGNAIDAGVATVFAAAVCEISHFGFGGESPVMIYDAKLHEIVVINGQDPRRRAPPSISSRDRERSPATVRSRRRFRR